MRQSEQDAPRASKREVPLRYPPNQVPPVTKVRSTLLSSSVRALTDRGLLERYQERLPSHMHHTILGAVAGSWLEIDVVIEHYRVMDTLGFDTAQQLSIGDAVGQAVRSYLIGNSSQVAQQPGATPWTILPHAQRTWDRLYVGGDVAIRETGPQQFVRTIYGLPLCDIPYFRHASRGILRSVISRYCTKCEVTELAATPTSLQWQVSWL